MHRYLYYIAILLGMQAVTAQTHEIGVFLGGSNPISDVGRTHYVLPNKLAFGGLYKWNFHDKMALRLQVSTTNLTGKDKQSDVVGKVNRGFSFSNKIVEASLGAEYNFFKFNMHKPLDRPITPYLFTGISYIEHDDLYFESLLIRQQEARKTSKIYSTWALPVVLGVKAKMGIYFVVAVEVGTRFTFTNNLDGSTPKYSASFGNVSTKDYYTFSGVTLTYTFGRKPCYCN
ncbi:type IX secretion system protein PorG [Capnocytophaga stomatis]|uniref:DUF6089 family protein n=1 Tax=Capnocytophaga stomatis TaxID=1848904 RepID=A0ABW8Q866_9FLAO